MNTDDQQSTTIVVARSKTLQSLTALGSPLFVFGTVVGGLKSISDRQLLMAISSYDSLSDDKHLKPGGLPDWKLIAIAETTAEIAARVDSTSLFARTNLECYVSSARQIATSYCEEIGYTDHVLRFECNTIRVLEDYESAVIRSVLAEIGTEQNYDQIQWDLGNRLIAGRLKTAIELIEAEIAYG